MSRQANSCYSECYEESLTESETYASLARAYVRSLKLVLNDKLFIND
jgi:hypothetical protein